jgi:DNA-binding MarR family transcriptional regulator/N-acetylglutamate synthase-like GNAT family acetyltransferase
MDFMNQLGPLVLASRLKILSDTLMQGVSRIYREFHVDFQPRWFPVTYYLYHIGPAQVTHLASALRQTHPAVLQVVNTMHKKGLVKVKKDKEDQRKTIITLSSHGYEMAKNMEEIWEVISSAAGKLIDENYIKILENIALLEDALDQEDIYSRIKREYILRNLPQIRIEEYTDRQADEYCKLNIQWLEETVGVSDYDRQVLGNPRKEVLEIGGKIYMAHAGTEIIGTLTLVPLTKDKMELTKLAVKKPYRRLGVGEKLTAFAIEETRRLGYSSLLLLTHPTLKEAIVLYKKKGFVETGPDPDLPDPTGRCSLTMQLKV